MNVLRQHSLLLGHLLCLVVVVLTALPVLRHPRLEADDYRYLNHIQQVEDGTMGLVESMTVENRWDHLWFMQEQGRIRFFRPTVVLSYAADCTFWGVNHPFGLTLSNVWIHLLCTWLVGFLLHRLLGAGLPAVASTVLFAGLATHSECIWYISGRTDSLAALGFLAAFSAHVSGWRWSALPLFAFGFITKELVVVAPAVFFIYDCWIEMRKLDWKLYAAYGVAACGILLLKQFALGGNASDFVHPYLLSPFDAGFLGHLWLQLRSYAGNLLAAEVTVPFADAATVAQLHRPVFPILGSLLMGALAWFLRRDRRFWLLLLLGFLTWLPTCMVYLSERYLYLPSFAFAGFFGLAVASLNRKWRVVAAIFLFAFALFHAVELHSRHVEVAKQPGSVSEMMGQLAKAKGRIETGDRLLLVNLPGQFVRAQFAQDILQVVFKDTALKADVLTMMPGQDGTEWKQGDAYPVMGAGVQVSKAGARTLVLEGRVLAPGQPPHHIQEPGFKAFDWTPLDKGEYATSTLKVRIVAGDKSGATSIEFTFFEPLENAVAVVWRADCSNLNEHPWIRRKNATVELVRP
jgi:hypothetical protein